MYKQKLGISIGKDFDITISAQLEVIKKVGFDAISPIYRGDNSAEFSPLWLAPGDAVIIRPQKA